MDMDVGLNGTFEIGEMVLAHLIPGSKGKTGILDVITDCRTY